jgi:hypothetical protein
VSPAAETAVAMRRWPPAIWILVYVGSILILNGGHPTWRPVELAIGIGLAVVAFGLAFWSAAGPWPGRPRPKGLYPAVGVTAGFYAVTALAAGLFAGPEFAVATIAAGLIPLTVVTLSIAAARSKTAESGGRYRDLSAADHDDPYPAIGLDDERPLGDTPDAHDEINPHDLPKDHPGRTAAERLAEAGRGTTRGGVTEDRGRR